MKNYLLFATCLITSLLFAQTNIYNTNGTLTGNRTVTMGGYGLRFTPSAGGSFFINGVNGNVGINNVTPTERLDVDGNIQAQVGYFTNSLANGQTFTNSMERNIKCRVFTAGTLLDAAAKYRSLNFYDFPQSNLNSAAQVYFSIDDRSYYTRFKFWANQGSTSDFVLLDKTQVENFKINDDGSNNISLVMPKANSFIGIGTTSFTDGTDTYKLSVNGNIRAHRVKVYTTWADYVFEEDYHLPTLSEVEQHIKEKGHLKDVPSAVQVEANGIELGEMNKILLQKIEELTIYMIEQNKINELQSKQIEELTSRLNSLSEKK